MRDLEEVLAEFTHDPLGYAYYAFPWHEEGDLSDYPGPRQWQSETLETIGLHLRESRFEPLLLAVASGHGLSLIHI